MLSSDALGDGDRDMSKEMGRHNNWSLDGAIDAIVRGDRHGGGRDGQRSGRAI